MYAPVAVTAASSVMYSALVQLTAHILAQVNALRAKNARMEELLKKCKEIIKSTKEEKTVLEAKIAEQQVRPMKYRYQAN